MGQVIVIEFITLDGVVSDPDGSAGTPTGGWVFRHGPETVAGDKFELAEVLDSAVMLLGRAAWQLFSRIWPGRSDPFADKMNAIPSWWRPAAALTPRPGPAPPSSTALCPMSFSSSASAGT